MLLHRMLSAICHFKLTHNYRGTASTLGTNTKTHNLPYTKTQLANFFNSNMLLLVDTQFIGDKYKNTLGLFLPNFPTHIFILDNQVRPWDALLWIERTFPILGAQSLLQAQVKKYSVRKNSILQREKISDNLKVKMCIYGVERAVCVRNRKCCRKSE